MNQQSTTQRIVLNYRYASPGDEVTFVMALPRELDRIGPVHKTDTVVYVRADGDEGEAAQPVSVESKMSRAHKVERVSGPDFGLDDSPSSKKRMGFAHMDIPVHCGLPAQRQPSAAAGAPPVTNPGTLIMPRARRLLRGVVGRPPWLHHRLRLTTQRRSAPCQRWCVAPFAKAPADRDG